MARAVTYEERLAHPRIMGNLSRGRSTTTLMRVELQGAFAVAEHFYAMAATFDPFFTQLLDVIGDIGIDEARKRVPVDTGATRDSINKDPGVWRKPERGEWSIRVGPTTFYAPFIEFGTIYRQPVPFMIPAGDLMERLFFASTLAYIEEFVSGRPFNLSQAASEVLARGEGGGLRSVITSWRTFLYSTVKFLGDVSVFTGRDFFGPSRAHMLSLAQGLGDVNSVMTSTIGQRVTMRLRGRVSGRIAGIGSRTLSHEATYSAFVGGSVGHRIYQRSVGRFTAPGFSLGG